jgi:hypothetical protein
MLREQGYHAVGVTRDEEAITCLGTGEFTALLIGSGVERASRGPLRRHAATHRTTVIQAHREPMQSLHDHLRETVIPHLELLTPQT